MFKVLLVYIFLSCFLILLVDAEKAITINLSFKQEKYITSVEMGKRCLAWLIENIDLFTGFSLDQEYYLQLKACEICNLVADLEGRTFDENDFHSSLYPHVKKNALTMSYDKFPTDKNTRFHNYGQVYHRHFEQLTHLVGLRYLELGVFMGNSLRAMHHYFPMADRFVGVDIDPGCQTLKFDAPNIHVLIGSQDDRQFLTHVNAMHGPFDLILDDASHNGSLTIAAFKILFPMLKDGGLYVIEDTTAFRDELEYFYGLVRHGLNAWRNDDDVTNGNDHCIDPYKMNRIPTSQDKNDDAVLFSIGDISFGYSSIVIRKEVKMHWIAGLLTNNNTMMMNNRDNNNKWV